jgi:hypothetical protein
MHEQRNAQGVHSSQQKKESPFEWIRAFGLIYAGMREKTHSASTQLKGTGTFEGTVTDLINLLEVWETSPNRVVERSTIAQSRRRRFHSNGLRELN